MAKPIRIQRKRTKGWKMPKNTVSVTRPGKFGNVYKLGDNGVPDAKTAIFFFQDLACWCKIGDPCHADILLKIANQS